MQWRPFLFLLLFACLSGGDLRAQTPRSTPKKPPVQKPAPGVLPFNANPGLLSLTPAPVPAARRLALVPDLPKSLQTNAVHVEVDAATNIGTIPTLWRGLSAEKADAPPAGWETLGARLNAGKASLIRLNPFAASTINTGADGTPQVDWEKPDALLLATAKPGTGIILALPPFPSLTPTAWQTFVTTLAKRYGEPKFGVARWELSASAEGAQDWYPAFAQAVRAALPTTPVGFCLTGDEAGEAAARFAALCVQKRVPCDSFAWKAQGSLREIARTFRQVHAGFGKFPALKNTSLMPELAGEAETAPLLAQTARLLEYAPHGKPNAALGALLSPASALEEGALSPGANALMLLNRLAGSQLAAKSDDTGVHCLASGKAGTVSILLWREEDTHRPDDTFVAVRLRGLRIGAEEGLRVTRATPESVAPAIADFPGKLGANDAEINLVLPPGAVTLLEIQPMRPPPVAITLAAPHYLWYGGDAPEILMTVHNNSGKPQPLALNLTSSCRGLVPSDLTSRAFGTLPPGGNRALRFRLFAPLFSRDTEALLTVRVGSQSHASLGFHIANPITVTLETPRLDLNSPGEKGIARLRILNRGSAPLPLTLLAQGKESEAFTLDGGKETVQKIEVNSPEADPGDYPVEVMVSGVVGTFAKAQVQVGVPVICRYATQKPTIDGDLSEWTSAAPMGMGRREQTQGKAWNGPSDLSAYAYAMWDAQYLYVACAVTDDIFAPPKTTAELTQGDSVQFALSAIRGGTIDRIGYGAGEHEFGMALVNGEKSVLTRLAPNAGASKARVAIRRDGTRLYYEAAIPWVELTPATPTAGAIYGFSIRINDRDGKAQGSIAWGSGLSDPRHPGQFPPLRLLK